MGNLISVVINACNAKKYMLNCIENIVNQTYKNLEIVVINNGSNNRFSNIYNKFEDKRIKVLNKIDKNMDLNEMIEIGINNTKGDYLYFVDANDFVDDDIIEKLYDLCLNYSVKMSMCDSANIYKYNYLKNDIKEKVEIMSGYEILNKDMMDDNICILNKLINKEVFKDNIFDNVDKMVLSIDRIAYSNQKKYFYCRNN
jgi:glycosyltransferase involved in cell wall biosynthesis